MPVRPIRQYPDPVLRVSCAEVNAFDADLRKLVGDLVETMYAAPGVGLAAPQIGLGRRVAVVDVTVGEEDGALHVLVNPVIVEHSGADTDLEACLSIAEFSEKIERPERIVVDAVDLDGKPFRLEAEGFLARAVCHEIDHLDGILFVDHLRGLKKEKARRHLRRLAREAEVAV